MSDETTRLCFKDGPYEVNVCMLPAGHPPPCSWDAREREIAAKPHVYRVCAPAYCDKCWKFWERFR